MTSNHVKILLLLVVLFAVQPIYATIPPPTGEDPMPITEWLLLLGASGVFYGFRKKMKK